MYRRPPLFTSLFVLVIAMFVISAFIAFFIKIAFFVLILAAAYYLYSKAARTLGHRSRRGPNYRRR